MNSTKWTGKQPSGASLKAIGNYVKKSGSGLAAERTKMQAVSVLDQPNEIASKFPKTICLKWTETKALWTMQRIQHDSLFSLIRSNALTVDEACSKISQTLSWCHHSMHSKEVEAWCNLDEFVVDKTKKRINESLGISDDLDKLITKDIVISGTNYGSLLSILDEAEQYLSKTAIW